MHPGRRIAGRFDRIVRHKPTGKLRILDFKFGKWAVAYPHGVAVQLAIYGNAELMAGVIEGTGETTEFEPMPDVDKSIAYVFHMPEDVASLHEFDIEAGWAACTELLFPIYDWRARRDLVSAAEPTNEGDDMRRLQVRKRIERLNDEQRKAVAAQWPKGVPTLREDGHTQDQLDAIVDVLDRVCGFEVDSLDRDAPPDEGMTMTDDDIEAIRRYVKELPSDAALIFATLRDHPGSAAARGVHRRQLRRRHDARAADPVLRRAHPYDGHARCGAVGHDNRRGAQARCRARFADRRNHQGHIRRRPPDHRPGGIKEPQ